MSDVTICIPAWQAEAFILKTLRCAAEQTYANIRILVSIDQCDDATAVLCKEQAALDSRIQSFQQPTRLGWAGNVNFLLDQVTTEFFCLYFHDDILLPHYTERLLQTLRDRPDAESVHCDMGHFGAKTSVSIGRSYEGSAVDRLLTFLAAPQRGSPLRSLTRSGLLKNGLRLPNDSVAGFWANEPYLMKLIAAGPAIRVPETLYLRWDQRAGGLTDGWKKLSADQIYAGFRSNTETALEIFRGLHASESELTLLTFSLYLQTMLKVRAVEKSAGLESRVKAEDLSASFANPSIPSLLDEIAPEIQSWIHEKAGQLAGIEKRNLGSP